jgi:extradiol dioxygenase family protein
LSEEPYLIAGQTLHGVDWVLSDSTGHLFIESKTKRLTINAKTLSDTASLDKDLSVMAMAVVQHYRNIRDAQDGRTKWADDGLPIFPLILTLEDWFIFSPRINEMLTQLLLQRYTHS